MLYWFLLFLAAVTAGLVGFGVVPYPGPYLRAQWNPQGFVRTWFRRAHGAALAAARRIRRIRLDRLSWESAVVYLLICATVGTAAIVAIGFRHVYFNRSDLPSSGELGTGRVEVSVRLK